MEITEEIIEEYLGQADVQPLTKSTYRRELRQYHRWAITTGRTEISKDNVLAFKQYLIDDGRRTTTINAYLTVVKTLADYLESEGKINGIGRVKGITVPDGFKRDCLTVGQARQLLSLENTGASALRDKAIIALLLGDGLRAIEVVRASVKDYTTKSGRTVLYVWGKGHLQADDYVVISPTTQRAIDDYLATRERLHGDDPLFCSVSNHNKNGRLTTKSVSRMVKDSMRQIGCDSPRLVCHSLRHSCFSYAAASGCSVREVQTLSRHARSSTVEIYLHDMDKLSGKAVYTVEAVLNGTDTKGIMENTNNRMIMEGGQ